jgi:gp32 DNA binding protein like
MASSLKELKQNRKSYEEKLLKEMEKASSTSQSKEDDRFWQPTLDTKLGTGFAIVRLLPPTKGEDIPYVRLWSHNFKGPKNQWYIENCLSTLGQQDPVNEFNSELWNTGTKSAQAQVRQQKRKLTYIANVLIIQDKAHPENNGKVKLWKFGAKIFDKIQSKVKPEFEDEAPLNVFDPWEGANLKIKMKIKDDYRNYDDSEFEAPAAMGDDKFIESVWEQQYPLATFIDPVNFKSYDELKARLRMVLDLDNATQSVAHKVRKSLAEEMDDEIPFAGHKESRKSIVDDDDDDIDLAKITAALSDDD